MVPDVGCSVEVYADMMKRLVEEMANALGPKDDWPPAAILIAEKKHTIFPMYYKDDEEKDMYADVFLPVAIKNTGAGIVGLVQSGVVRPSAHQVRRECVVVTCVSRDVTQIWLGGIQRHRLRHPTVLGWEFLPSSGVEGRFVAPIREALGG